MRNGLADATWYTCDVPKEDMRQLLTRKDWPGIRDTLAWFSLLGLTAWASLHLLNTHSWWAVIPYLAYCTIYFSSSNSRWHETSHGTAFKSAWLNEALYEISSFMNFRQSTLWRWSHSRHHSDTIIVGRDPEIVVTRPPQIIKVLTEYFPIELKKMLRHASGKMDIEAATFVPASEFTRVYWVARFYLLIHAGIILSSIYFHTLLPVLMFIVPFFIGGSLMLVYGLSQHVGLAEDVLDHRLNSRTIYMNWLNRFLYWNMNYHVEHHMFPLVPYHALPKLHEKIKDDCPKPYSGLIEAYKEIIPAIIKQKKNPSYAVMRKLPPPEKNSVSGKKIYHADSSALLENDWIPACDTSDLARADVIRFDYNHHTFAVYRSDDNLFFATDGICTHGNAHLADGMVIGKEIECAKHNGRFDLRDGSPKRQPVCARITTYPVKIEGSQLLINVGTLKSSTNAGITCTVVSNTNVATFIKELVLRPDNGQRFNYQPGDYIQLCVPARSWRVRAADISAAYLPAYENIKIIEAVINNDIDVTRNYSLASNPALDNTLAFNVRLAHAPEGKDCEAGIGSSFVFQLQAGDKVQIKGPFGDFHLKQSDKEIVYIGGGAGMAPIRSHISHLLESTNSTRKISYWYGARSSADVFYTDYFSALEKKYANFNFKVAVSCEDSRWHGLKGFIHEVLEREYLSGHRAPHDVEYYLCGPPLMIEAVRSMLGKLGVATDQISFDEF